MFPGSEVAIGVIARTTEERVSCERAAPQTGLRKRTALTIAPEVRRGSRAGESEFGRVVPDLLERALAKIPADVVSALEGRTSFYRSMGFDAENKTTGLTALKVVAICRVQGAEQTLFRTEIAEVISRRDEEAFLEPPSFQSGDAWDELEKIVGLEHHLGSVGGATEGRR